MKNLWNAEVLGKPRTCGHIIQLCHNNDKVDSMHAQAPCARVKIFNTHFWKCYCGSLLRRPTMKIPHAVEFCSILARKFLLRKKLRNI
jgi:hypothetical protein